MRRTAPGGAVAFQDRESIRHFKTVPVKAGIKEKRPSVFRACFRACFLLIENTNNVIIFIALGISLAVGQRTLTP